MSNNEKRASHERIISRDHNSIANSREYQKAWAEEYEEQERKRERIEENKARRLLNGE